MYNQKRAGAVLGYIYIALQSIISIIYIPILLNGIGKSEYGIYQIAGSFIAYFAAMESPLCASILKFYVEYKVKNDSKNMENVLAIGRRIFIILSVAFVLISIPAAFAIKESFANTFTEAEMTEVLWMCALMILNLIVSMNNYVYLAVINAHERFVFAKISSIITLILQPIIVVVIIQECQYAFAIVAVQCVLNVLMAYIRKYYAVKQLKCSIKHHGFDKSLFRGMMALTFATLGVALADQIFWKTDQIILGSFVGPEVVAEYSIGAQINAMYISVACVLGGVILPTVTKLIIGGSNNDVSQYFAKVGRLQSFLVVLILTGVIGFGKEFICLLAGDGYELSYYVALLLMIPYSIDLIQTCGSSILQARNLYGYRAKVMIVSALLNIGLTIILINLLGPIGSALSTAIAILLGNGAYLNYVYAKKMNLDLSEFLKAIYRVWGVGLIMLVIAYLVHKVELNNVYIQFLMHITLFTSVYVLLLYLFVLEKSEKQSIHKLMCRL